MKEECYIGTNEPGSYQIDMTDPAEPCGRKHDRLSEHARKARELGLSYGQYMCQYHPTLPKSEEYANPWSRVCPNCGAKFVPKRSTQIYCCRKCTDESKRPHYYGVVVPPRTHRMSIVGTNIETGVVVRFESVNAAQRFIREELNEPCGGGVLAKHTRNGKPYEYHGFVWQREER